MEHQLYRFIKASERLPEKVGWYNTIQTLNRDGFESSEYLSGSFWNGYYFNDETDNNNFQWLEPIGGKEGVLSAEEVLAKFDIKTFDEYNPVYERIKQAIQFTIDQFKGEQPKVEEGWVSVEDGLPDEDEEVIIFSCKHGDPKGARAVNGLAWYANKQWHLMDREDGLCNDIEHTPDNWKVTRWMPYPNEPKQNQVTQ